MEFKTLSDEIMVVIKLKIDFLDNLVKVHLNLIEKNNF